MKTDRIELVMEEQPSTKSKLGRYMRDWSTYLPIVLSVLSVIFCVVILVVLLVYVSNLKAEVSILKGTPVAGSSQALVASKSGAAYVRWGKTTCPTDNEQLYSGFAAGAVSSTEQLTGGGTNHLCMHPQPEWNRYDKSNDSLGYSWLYNVEFLSFSLGIFPDAVHGHNVPCSSCRSPRTSQVMIPGRRTCPPSWTKEYEGYVMSSHVKSQRTTFECVDGTPDVVEGTQNITGGSFLYFTTANCNVARGSIQQCPPYTHAKEITCVLCTK